MKSKPIIFILLVLISFIARAGSDSTVGKITALRYSEEGVYIQFENPPVDCNGGSLSRMHGILQTTHANYKTLVSGLLSAYLAEKDIQWLFYLDSSIPASCNTSLLVITAFETGK